MADNAAFIRFIIRSALQPGPYRTFRLGSPSYRQSEQSFVALCAPQDEHTRLLCVGDCALEAALQCELG